MESEDRITEEMERVAAPIPEEDLRAMAKSLSSNFHNIEVERNDEEKIKWIDHVLTALIDTAFATSISSNHRTAACNALCGITEKCLNSTCDALVFHVCSDAVFDKLQDLYFDRYYGAKDKCMKQVLSTIVMLLAKAALIHPSVPALSRRSLKRPFQILLQNPERSKAKPALHALQQYMSKDIISPLQIVTAFQQRGQVSDLNSNQADEWSALQWLLEEVLEWTPFRDVAPSVGQFIACFLRTIPTNSPDSQSNEQSKIAVWVEPLVRSVARHSDCIQLFRTYVFPGIFQRGSLEYWSLLRYLRVESHLDLNSLADKGDETADERHDLPTEHLVLFTALQVGKEQGLISELATSNSRAITMHDGFICISETVLIRLLNHASEEKRLSGLSLLLTSTRSTKPCTSRVLHVLIRRLPFFFAEPDPSFRGQVQGLVQTLINRMRMISATLAGHYTEQQRQKENLSLQGESSSLFDSHRIFVKQLIQLLTCELHPAATYQRHISALKSLIIILRSGLDPNVSDSDLSRQAKLDANWSFQFEVVNSALRRALLDNLQNPFEDVRQAALEILKLGNVQVDLPHGFVAGLSDDSILARAHRLMTQSGRADHSDCVARLNDLLAYKTAVTAKYHVMDKSVVQIIDEILSFVEHAIEVARSNLSTAVAKHPIHGYLTALRYIFDRGLQGSAMHSTSSNKLRAILDRCFKCLTDIWSCVKPILCNDAPEGFMPHEICEETDLTTKKVSSFAWRALKESSLLLRALIDQPAIDIYTNCEKGERFHLAFSGDLCFEQLAELRHRGAFSTVAQTFAALCRRCVLSQDSGAQHLLKEWYKVRALRTLELIEQNGLVTTRRSAGIPALIVGILAAGPGFPRLEDAITDLRNLAAQPASNFASSDSQLPQVHALNSLKAIFNNSILGEHCECYVVEVMSVATTCLGSNIWSIRNSGLMVFRGLVDRILGSNESLDDNSNVRSSGISRLSYDRYPGLVKLVYRVLETTETVLKTSSPSSRTKSDPTAQVETVFTVLDLLRRAFPPYSHLLNVRRLVLQAVGNPHWHIRDLAARTFIASLRKSEVVDATRTLFDTKSLNNNELHGRLLCIRYAIAALASANSATDTEVSASTTSRSHHMVLVDSSHLHQCIALIFDHVERFLSAPTCDSVREAFFRIIILVGQLVLDASRTDLKNLAAGSVCRGFRSVYSYGYHLGFQSPFIYRQIRVIKCLNILIEAKSGSFSGDLLPIWTHPEDAEVSAFVLESLRFSLHAADSRTFRFYLESIAHLLQDKCENRVLRAGEKILLDAMDVQFNLEMITHGIIRNYFGILDIGERLLTEQYPDAVEHDIRAWGWSLCVKWQQDQVPTALLIKETSLWVEVIQSSLIPWNDLSLRNAAIRSMKGFAAVSARARKIPSRLRLQLALAIYDSLNDDDDELRKLGAEICSLFLFENGRKESLAREVLVPPAASEALCKYLVRHHSGQAYLMKHAADRFTRDDSGTRQNPKSVVEVLQDIAKEEEILFVIEKQNLYIDEVREAKVWSTILQAIEPKCYSSAPATIFTDWAVNGLEALVNAARMQEDGALGWTSNPRAFVLGIRVIRAVETILLWRTTSTRIGANVSTIITNLQTLHDVGKANHINELWISTIEAIIQRVIKRRLEEIVTSLTRLPIDIC